MTGDVASEATLERMRAAVDELGPLRLAVHAMRSPVVDGFLDLVMDDGAVVMVTPRPMHDLDRYAEQLRERRVSANAVVVESPDGIVVADVADVVSFLASDAAASSPARTCRSERGSHERSKGPLGSKCTPMCDECVAWRECARYG